MIKNLAIGGGSNRVLLLLALLLGLVAAILIGLYLSSLEGDGEGTAPVTTRAVVVANQDIPPLTEITPEMISIEPIPLDLVLSGAFLDSEDAIGETTQVAIVEGEQLLQSKLTSAETVLTAFGDDAPLSLIIPDGMRGFSVAVSSVGAAGGLIRPGDHVDLILTGGLLDGPETGTLTPASACYALQNVQVLALNTAVTLTTSQSDAAGIAAADIQAEASRATLAVTPEQAWQLAAYQGSVSGGGVDKQLWLSLRPFGETSAAEGLPACQSFPGA